MLDLLTNPDAFFERRAENPSLFGPVLVVLLVAVIGIVGSLPVLRVTTAVLPPEMRAFASLGYVFGIVGGVIGTLVVWVLYAVAFYVVSGVAFDGEGSLYETFALTGWGFVPQIPGAIVSAFVYYSVFGDAEVPANLSDPQQMRAFIQGLRNDPLLTVAGVVGIAFLLWSALLWTFAVQHGRDITRRHAAYTVAIPVAVAILITLVRFV